MKGRKIGRIIDTCDNPSCTRSAQFEVFFLDHEWDKWFVCALHREELISIYGGLFKSQSDLEAA